MTKLVLGAVLMLGSGSAESSAEGAHASTHAPEETAPEGIANEADALAVGASEPERDAFDEGAPEADALDQGVLDGDVPQTDVPGAERPPTAVPQADVSGDAPAAVVPDEAVAKSVADCPDAVPEKCAEEEKTPAVVPPRGLLIGGGVLTAFGIGSVAAGAALSGIGRSQVSRDGDDVEIIDYRMPGAIALGVGAAALATGVVLLLVDRKRERPSVAFAPGFSPHGVAFSLSKRF
jgi:hypothetical protein